MGHRVALLVLAILVLQGCTPGNEASPAEVAKSAESPDVNVSAGESMTEYGRTNTDRVGGKLNSPK